MTKIFISYARSDGEKLAEFLHKRLTGCGYDVWKDSHDLEVGRNFPGGISDALETANDFIILVSPAALRSEWVNNEVNMAMAARSRILPIVFDVVNNDDIPLMLRTKNYVLMKGTEDWQALIRIVDSLEGGKNIPRVYNLSGHADIMVRDLLVLGHSPFEKADLPTPDSVVEKARKLAQEAWPYLKSGAGIVPPGHPALATAVLAYLLGTENQMPRLYYTYRVEEKFGISGDRFVDLQGLRDEGFEYRSRI